MELNEPPILGGDAPVGMEPIFLSQNKNVIVDTTKPADRAENALLVRVYECMGAGTAASFTAAKPIVSSAQIWQVASLHTVFWDSSAQGTS